MNYSSPRTLFSLYLLFFFFSSSLVFSAPNWKLVWSDEFDGPEIDSTKWSWMTDCNGGGNQERQCYTDHRNNSMINNGSLVLKPVFGRACDPEDPTKCQDTTSARLTTSKKWTWTGGKFEWRAQLPAGQYLWPALWLFIDNPRSFKVPLYGEIDVIEGDGGNPPMVDQTVWWNTDAKYDMKSQEKVYKEPTFNSQTSFHTYTLEWNDTAMVFLLDGKMTFSADLTILPTFPGMSGNVFQKGGPGYAIIMNVAVGGTWFGKDNIPSAAKLKELSKDWTEMRVDYVRVYEDSNSYNKLPLGYGSVADKITINE